MKRKIFSVFFALVLALSLTLVPAMVSADVSTIVLSTVNGTAEWTTDQSHEGNYSIHLAAPGKCDWGDYEGTYAQGIIQIPIEGLTLGEITDISWWNYLVDGYPPALRIKLDVDADGESDYHLVGEFAYQEWLADGYVYVEPWNPYTHYKPGLEATNDFYYPTYDTWMQTFHTTDDASSDPAGARTADTETTTVGGNTIFWVMVVGGTYNVDWHSAPYAGLPSYFATLEDYQTGTVTRLDGGAVLQALGNAEILMFEFAITNEIGLTENPAGHEVYFDDLTINGDPYVLEPPSGSVGMTAASEAAVIGISVSPTSIDFGAVTSGATVSGSALTVSNTGNVGINVDAEIIADTYFDPLGNLYYFYTAALRLNGSPSDQAQNPTSFGAWELTGSGKPLGDQAIEVNGSRPLTTGLDCPQQIKAATTYTGAVVFWAEQA